MRRTLKGDDPRYQMAQQRLLDVERILESLWLDSGQFEKHLETVYDEIVQLENSFRRRSSKVTKQQIMESLTRIREGIEDNVRYAATRAQKTRPFSDPDTQRLADEVVDAIKMKLLDTHGAG